MTSSAAPPRRYRSAVDQLAAAQKPSQGAPPYSRWVNRPLGRRLAALAYVSGRSPNQVTLVSAVATFSGFALIALVEPRWWVGLLAGGLAILGYALDAADGQLARLQGGGSASGEWLDHTVDAVKMSSVHLVILVSLLRFTDEPGWGLLAIPMLFQAASGTFFVSFMLMDQLRRARGGTGRAPSNGGTAQTVAALPTDYGVLAVVLLAVGVPSLFVPIYGLLCAGFVVVLCGALLRWWREVRSWDHP